MAMQNARDSILLIGASGRTGLCVLRYLCAAAVPVVGVVRRRDRLPDEPRLTVADIAVANLERPADFAPLIERAAHVIWLAGSARNSLSPGAWQLEVESFSTCIEFADRSHLDGRWTYVSCSEAEPVGGTTWAEARWREMKREAEQALTASNLNYFILRTERVSGAIAEEPRVRVGQGAHTPSDADLPCNVLAFLLTGVVLAGAAHRAEATVRIDPSGMKLQEAVQAFGRLRRDRPVQGVAGLKPPRGAMHRR